MIRTTQILVNVANSEQQHHAWRNRILVGVTAHGRSVKINLDVFNDIVETGEKQTSPVSNDH